MGTTGNKVEEMVMRWTYTIISCNSFVCPSPPMSGSHVWFALLPADIDFSGVCMIPNQLGMWRNKIPTCP